MRLGSFGAVEVDSTVAGMYRCNLVEVLELLAEEIAAFGVALVQC